MSHRCWRLALILALTLPLIAVVKPAVAGPPTEQLRSQVDRVFKILHDPELKKETRAAERRSAIRKAAEEIFDFRETARSSLGPHWRTRSAAEQAEFTKLFTDLIERSYLSNVELYGGEKIAYTGETLDGQDRATVRTRIVTKRGSEIPVNYRMLRKGDRWLVYDVKIEELSLVSNFRKQFDRVIRSSSYEELVKRMKTRQDEFLEEARAKRTSQR